MNPRQLERWQTAIQNLYDELQSYMLSSFEEAPEHDSRNDNVRDQIVKHVTVASQILGAYATHVGVPVPSRKRPVRWSMDPSHILGALAELGAVASYDDVSGHLDTALGAVIRMMLEDAGDSEQTGDEEEVLIEEAMEHQRAEEEYELQEREWQLLLEQGKRG